MDNYSIISTASSFMWVFVLERIMTVFYRKRRTSTSIMIISFAIFFIANVFQHFFFRNRPIENRLLSELIVTLIGYFVITFNYESTILKRVVVTGATYLLSLSIGVVASVIVLNIFSPDSILSDEMISISNVISLPLAYFLLTLLQRFKNIKNNNQFFPSVLIIPAIFLFLLICFLFLGFGYWLDADIPSNYYAIFVGTCIMGLSFLIFYLYDRLSGLYEDKLKVSLNAQEREYYFAQCQLMQKSLEKVRSVRHDMKMHLSTVKSYSTKIKANDITDYVDNILGNIELSEVYSETGNIAFDSIINFKLQNAKKDNIKLDIRLLVPETLNIEVNDIVIILGNLLDNALYAVSMVEQKMIKLDIEFTRKSLFIQIQNTFDGIVKYTDESDINDKTIATRKNSDENGYGLKNIKSSVEKYNGHIDITNQDSVFCVTVLMYVCDV